MNSVVVLRQLNLRQTEPKDQLQEIKGWIAEKSTHVKCEELSIVIYSSKNSCYAFVTCKCTEDRDELVKALNGTSLNGKITIAVAGWDHQSGSADSRKQLSDSTNWVVVLEINTSDTVKVVQHRIDKCSEPKPVIIASTVHGSFTFEVSMKSKSAAKEFVERSTDGLVRMFTDAKLTYSDIFIERIQEDGIKRFKHTTPNHCPKEIYAESYIVRVLLELYEVEVVPFAELELISGLTAVYLDDRTTGNSRQKIISLVGTPEAMSLGCQEIVKSLDLNVLRCLIKSDVSGLIFGKQGANIKRIQQESETTIIASAESYDRVFSIRPNLEGLPKAEVRKRICDAEKRIGIFLSQDKYKSSMKMTSINTQPRFKSITEYVTAWVKLVGTEEIADERYHTELTFENVKLQWSLQQHGVLIASFSALPLNTESIGRDNRIRVGATFAITDVDTNTTDEGVICKVPNIENELVSFRIKPPSPLMNLIEATRESQHLTFNLRSVWKNATAFGRMKYAVERLGEKGSLSEPIFNVLVGGKNIAPMRYDNPLILSGNFNEAQRHASQHALIEPMTIIQGPPGTGKSTVCVAICFETLKQDKAYPRPLLVCASSNVAVDNLIQSIVNQKPSIKLTHICATSRMEFVNPKYNHLTLQAKQQLAIMEKGGEHHRLIQRKEDGKLTEDERKKLNNLDSKLENSILDNSDIIAGTCVTAGRLRGNFPWVLLDECGQATEPETLIPIMKGCRKLILVGDHEQLEPFTAVLNSNQHQRAYQRSLFQRLVTEEQNKPILLNHQYRMHPKISAFPSITFYDGLLLDCINADERKLPNGIDWPFRNHPTVFLNVTSLEEQLGTSYKNLGEANMVVRLTLQMFKFVVSRYQVFTHSRKNWGVVP